MSASDFFTSKPEHSEDIKLTDDDGFLKNPLTGGSDWFHSSNSAGTIFSDDWLDKKSTFLGTYHTADPHETLKSGYLHVNKIKMKNPLVLANHHDDNDMSMDDTSQQFSRGQFLTVGQLVRHYAKKYGPSVLPQYGDPNAPDAERKFYEEQSARNDEARKGWEDRVAQIKNDRESDPWGVSEENDPAGDYLPPEPSYDTKQFSKDYLANFSPSQRLHVVRQGLMRDGYDGAIFHYQSGQNPSIFVVKPSQQIVPQRVVGERISSSGIYEGIYETGGEFSRENFPVKPLESGLNIYARKNDLFESEKARGQENRAS